MEPRALSDSPHAIDTSTLPCPHCGYDLRATTIEDEKRRCPECGQFTGNTQLTTGTLPWLHRATLGRPSAYFHTLYRIFRHPWKWPTELGPSPDLHAARAFVRIGHLIFFGIAFLTLNLLYRWPSFFNDVLDLTLYRLTDGLRDALDSLPYASGQPFTDVPPPSMVFHGSLDLLIPVELFAATPGLPALALVCTLWLAPRTFRAVVVWGPGGHRNTARTSQLTTTLVGATYLQGSLMLPFVLASYLLVVLLTGTLASAPDQLLGPAGIAQAAAALLLLTIMAASLLSLLRLFRDGPDGRLGVAFRRMTTVFALMMGLLTVWFVIIGYVAAVCTLIWRAW